MICWSIDRSNMTKTETVKENVNSRKLLDQGSQISDKVKTTWTPANQAGGRDRQRNGHAVERSKDRNKNNDNNSPQDRHKYSDTNTWKEKRKAINLRNRDQKKIAQTKDKKYVMIVCPYSPPSPAATWRAMLWSACKSKMHFAIVIFSSICAYTCVYLFVTRQRKLCVSYGPVDRSRVWCFFQQLLPR